MDNMVHYVCFKKIGIKLWTTGEEPIFINFKAPQQLKKTGFLIVQLYIRIKKFGMKYLSTSVVYFHDLKCSTFV